MTDIELFLSTLFAAKPAPFHILLWELAKKQSHFFLDWRDAAAFASTHNVNIYAGGGLSPQDYGAHERCKMANIAGIVGLYADIDVLGGAHKSKVLPPSVADALWILPEEFEPSVLIDSGHGLQAWWLFRETLVFGSDEERTAAQAVARKWDRFLKNRAARRGWTIDSCFDFARILRIPGTINRKQGLPDAEARILDITEVRYELAQFSKLLDEVPALKQDPEKIARELMPVAVGEFTYDSNATVNPAIFKALWENDLKFRVTWSGHRVDFKDQSQSSYDLALGNIFYDAGVSDQETVNALVHHRRIRNQKPKPNPPYYYKRTLQMIRTRKKQPEGAADLKSVIDALATGTLAAEGETPSLEQIEQVAALKVEMPAAAAAAPVASTPEIPQEVGDALKSLNEALYLRIKAAPVLIGRIVWVRGTKPTWRIELRDGQMVTLTNQAQFSTWEGLDAAFTCQVNGTIATPAKKSDWAKTMKPLFQACLIEESAGAENDIRGEIGELLKEYFSDKGVYPAETIFADRKSHFLPLAYGENQDRIAVYAQNMCDWFMRTRNERREKHEIISGLSALGGKRITVYPTRDTSQSRYLLPENWRPEPFQTQEAADRLGLPRPVHKEPQWTS
jgi:hypothetical protein